MGGQISLNSRYSFHEVNWSEMEEVQQKCDFFLNAYEMGVEKYALMFKPKEERENS